MRNRSPVFFAPGAWVAGRRLAFVVAAGVALGVARPADAGIAQSKHNLSASGPGEVRALSESRVCVFCHTPHQGRRDAPLWNRKDATTSYVPYDSPTLKATPGQPTGTSKLCLSCHDGTIALGDLVSEKARIPMTGSGIIPPGRARVGMDLRDDHPVSIDYFEALGRSNGKLAPPGAMDHRIGFDANSRLQCTSCHDPHSDKWERFLVMDNQGAALCRQCHVRASFGNSLHATSGKRWGGAAGGGPWGHTKFDNVADNACMNCHRSHTAGRPGQLLTRGTEKDVCLECHNGNVAGFNLRAVFQKPYTHPVEQTSGLHEAGEDVLSSGDHVSCSDCHDPHGPVAGGGGPPFAKPSVGRGVRGIAASGSAVDEASYEYELCFRCHGDSAPEPLNAIRRQVSSYNTREEFSPSSISYHPVAGVGVSDDVPSLSPPLDEAALIYCSDCHGNDNAQRGVVGSAGPHGSNYEFLLVRQYVTGDRVNETPQAYALCYRCHSRASILSDVSFGEHRRHIDDQNTPCSVCHDPHGIDAREGRETNNAHLINFDLSVVQQDPETGYLEYRSTGVRRGECYLTCHGEVHTPNRYGR